MKKKTLRSLVVGGLTGGLCAEIGYNVFTWQYYASLIVISIFWHFLED